MKLSVILATYNWPQALAVSLTSLMHQRDAGDFEVVVADDGSRDETRALVESFAARAPMPIRHVWQTDDGYRLAAIRNKAIAAAQGDYLIFSDGDCFMLPNFIRTHRRLAERGYFVTGKRSYLRDGITQKYLSGALTADRESAWRWFFRAMTNQSTRPFQFITLPWDGFRYKKADRWQQAQTCNFAAWRDDVFRINGFDESYRGHGLEDSDFALRLLRAGVKRKLGDYASVILHLNHPRRVGGAGNGSLFEELLASDRIRARQGLDELALNPAAA